MDEQNDKYKMDQLVDRGWADMEKKLDAKMPSGAKKQRRIIPVLILLLIAVAAGGTFMYFLSEGNQPQPGQKNENTETNQPVDYASDQLDANDQRTALPAGAYIQKTKDSEKESALNNASSNSIRKDNLFSAPQSRLSKGNLKFAHSKPISDEVSTTFASKINDSENDQIIPGSASQEPANQTVPSAKQMNFAQPVRIRHLTQICLFDKDRMRTEKIDLALYFKDEVPTRFCKDELAFQTGMISENLASLGGFEAGLLYRKYITEQLFFNVGLSYKMMDKKHFSNALLKTSLFGLSGDDAAFDEVNWVENRYDYELLNSEIRNNTIGYEYVLGLVNKLHYLEFPVQLGYKWQRFGIYGGINFSLMIHGSNAVRDFSQVYFNTIVLSDEVLFNKQMFNRLDLSPQLGLEYNIWKGFTLYSYYNHGLIHIAKAESAEKIGNASFADRYAEIPSVRIDRNRYFVVGLRYDLPFCMLR